MKRSFAAGFTFIEILIASVIVAILAAVSIPIYIGYQTDARHTSVDQLANSAAAAADGYYRKTLTDPAVADLHLFYDTAKYQVTIVVRNDGADASVRLKGWDGYTKPVSYR
jgi:prepilin-type N-terminal cleavage/methylation domain-containing protein